MLADGTFQFKLRKSIEVAGCNDPVAELTFHECGEGYDSYYMKLRKFVVSGQLEAQKLMKEIQISDDRDDLASGEEVKSLHQIDEDDHMSDAKGFAEVLKITLGRSDQLEELIKVFGHMVGNRGGNATCTAVAGAQIKEGAWHRIHIEDKIDAAVQYCAFFGIGLDQASSNASEAAPESPMAAKAL